MAISNDKELKEAVATASALVQGIQDYCGRSLRDEAKISFPRGLIGTAQSYRVRFPGYLSADQVSSCAYGFMYLDVLWWVVSRTDLTSVGRQMAIKSAIITLGMLVEAPLYIPNLPRNRILSKESSAGVKARLKKAKEMAWISEEQRIVLDQLWDHRNNVHVKLLEDSERDLYKVEHVNAPHEALLVLLKGLCKWHVDGGQLEL